MKALRALRRFGPLASIFVTGCVTEPEPEPGAVSPSAYECTGCHDRSPDLAWKVDEASRSEGGYLENLATHERIRMTDVGGAGLGSIWSFLGEQDPSTVPTLDVSLPGGFVARYQKFPMGVNQLPELGPDAETPSRFRSLGTRCSNRGVVSNASPLRGVSVWGTASLLKPGAAVPPTGAPPIFWSVTTGTSHYNSGGGGFKECFVAYSRKADDACFTTCDTRSDGTRPSYEEFRASLMSFLDSKTPAGLRVASVGQAQRVLGVLSSSDRRFVVVLAGGVLITAVLVVAASTGGAAAPILLPLAAAL